MALFDLVPQLQLALDPELAVLDRLLDDEVLFQQVKADLARRHPQSRTRGRPSTPVEVVLRMLIVRRLYDWSYAETERFVGDSLVLRHFCRLGLAPAPDDTTLIRWAACLAPATLERLTARVVELAVAARVTRGRQLRLDSTVVETTIHYPTDSALVADGVRVLGRLLRRAKALAPALAGGLVRDRTRSAARLAHRLARGARRVAADQQAGYRRLLGVARASRRQAAQVAQHLTDVSTAAAARLVAELEQVGALVERVVDQTRRRVLAGEAVPAREKVLSLFEPHTELICRGKARRAAEFGHKLWLGEVEGGLISQYQVLAGAPSDVEPLLPSLDAHVQQFGHPPAVLAMDRGGYSAANEAGATARGVTRVCLPRAGPRTAARAAHERQAWFRRARRWRAGIEGRISVAKRRGWLGRCRDHGAEGFARWVGVGVLTSNLVSLARATAAR
jgi:IS5 family transposase